MKAGIIFDNHCAEELRNLKYIFGHLICTNISETN
jgi:hypothetical protein